MQLKGSLQLTACLFTAHVFSATLVYLLALPEHTRYAIIALIVLSFGYYLLRDVLLLLPDSWREIHHRADGITVKTRKGEQQHVTITHKTFVCPFFIVLYVKPENSFWPNARVIFPDALQSDLFRKFCVVLRFA